MQERSGNGVNRGEFFGLTFRLRIPNMENLGFLNVGRVEKNEKGFSFS